MVEAQLRLRAAHNKSTLASWYTAICFLCTITACFFIVSFISYYLPLFTTQGQAVEGEGTDVVELMLVTWFVMWSEVQLIFGSWFYYSSTYIYNNLMIQYTTEYSFDDAINTIYYIYLMLYSFGLMLNNTFFNLFFVFILFFIRSYKWVILP